MILKRLSSQEESALQSKKIKLQEITRQEEKEKEHVQLELKEKLETTLQKIETLSKDVETLKDFEQERTGHQENKRVKLEKEKQKEAFEGKQQEIGKELEHNAEHANPVESNLSRVEAKNGTKYKGDCDLYRRSDFSN